MRSTTTSERSEDARLVDQHEPVRAHRRLVRADRAAVSHGVKRLRQAAGNFYVNDKPTGAVVGQQPFGGGRASGTNDKAGSAYNLLRWASPRVIKETFVPPARTSAIRSWVPSSARRVPCHEQYAAAATARRTFGQHGSQDSAGLIQAVAPGMRGRGGAYPGAEPFEVLHPRSAYATDRDAATKRSSTQRPRLIFNDASPTRARSGDGSR